MEAGRVIEIDIDGVRMVGHTDQCGRIHVERPHLSRMAREADQHAIARWCRLSDDQQREALLDRDEAEYEHSMDSGDEVSEGSSFGEDEVDVGDGLDPVVYSDNDEAMQEEGMDDDDMSGGEDSDDDGEDDEEDEAGMDDDAADEHCAADDSE